MQLDDRAHHVCATCKTRKKACDKLLPRCGYCSKRGLACTYETANRPLPGIGTDSGTPFLVFLTGSQYSTSKSAHRSPDHCSPSSIHSNTNGRLDLNTTLNVHVVQTLTNLEKSLPEISEQYFQGLHTWLPIICPRIFQEDMSAYIVPPADWSIRTLAMSLLVVRPPTASAGNSATDAPEPIYVFVKMLLSQVQAEVFASISLLQAGVLLSAYEYACGHPEAAYVSLEACVGMAHILRVNECQNLRTTEPPDKRDQFRLREKWNTWWGIVILQRLIMIELRDRVSRPTADFPTDVSPLPSSLKPDPTSRECVFQFSEQLLNSAESGSHIDWIARQAQAVRLFDQILQVINYQTDEELKIVELTKIDTKLQSFLKFLMNESGFEDWKIRSAVTATVLRSLFALHEEVLTKLACTENTASHIQAAEASRAMIHTCCKIIIDIARHHMGQNEESPAPCCIYCNRTARKHTELRYAALCNTETADDVATMRALEESLSSGTGTS